MAMARSEGGRHTHKARECHMARESAFLLQKFMTDIVIGHFSTTGGGAGGHVTLTNERRLGGDLLVPQANGFRVWGLGFGV